MAVALAITAAAAVMAPTPASASAINTFCTLSVRSPMPNSNATLVTADALVNCFGGSANINLSLDLIRDATVVNSAFAIGSFGASALTLAACVPGTYTASAWATIWYPPGNIPASDSIHWQTPNVTISCIVTPTPLAVANPGSQSTFVYDSDSLQLAATGGTAPYTWSATGLPTGFSINASTGLIGGTATRVALSTVTATVSDAAGRSASTQFTWNVRREPCPRC